MASRLATAAHAASSTGLSTKRVLTALAGLAAFAIAYGANREIAQDVDRQVAQEERAFCRNIGVQAGARYESCLQDVSRLVRREQEIRAVEF